MVQKEPLGNINETTDTVYNTSPSATLRESIASTVDEKSVEKPNNRETQAADIDWAALIPQLDLGAVVLQLARNCVLKSYTRDRLELLLDQNAESLRQKKREETLQSALSAYFGRTISLRIETGQPEITTPAQLAEIEIQNLQQQAEASIREDPFIMALEEHFDARVLTGSIKRKNI